jgi:hypothetical protein
MSGVARIKLRISPNAKRSAIVGRYEDGWKVRIVSANVSRDEIVAIEGLSAEVVAAALAQASVSASTTSRNRRGLK